MKSLAPRASLRLKASRDKRSNRNDAMRIDEQKRRRGAGVLRSGSGGVIELRTGLDGAVIESTMTALQGRGLSDRSAGYVRPTELGFRFLNDFRPRSSLLRCRDDHGSRSRLWYGRRKPDPDVSAAPQREQEGIHDMHIHQQRTVLGPA